jgi:hypothetical protein
VVLVAAGGALVLARVGGKASGDPNRLIDPVHGVIGGVAVRETRTRAELLLGTGTLVAHHEEMDGSGRPYEVEDVRYASSGLDVEYLSPVGASRRGRVWAVFTRDGRYHTADGLHAGSALADARRERTLTCSNLSPAMGYADCQGGLGTGQPLTNFQVRGGVVGLVVAVSDAD